MVGLHHLIVVIQDALLKNTETFRAVQGNSEIHSGFIVLQLRAPGNDAVYRNIQWSTEIKCNVGSRREAVEIAQPVRRTSASAIPRERGVDIAIGENQIAAMQQWHDLTLATVGKICRMQKRERGGRQQAALFAPAGC